MDSMTQVQILNEALSISQSAWKMYNFRCSPRAVVVNMLDCNMVDSEFERQSRYYVQFRTNTIRIIWTPLSPNSYRLNSITAVFLQGWLWYKIAHEGWYAIKQSYKTIILSAG